VGPVYWVHRTLSLTHYEGPSVLLGQRRWTIGVAAERERLVRVRQARRMVFVGDTDPSPDATLTTPGNRANAGC
jgi:hypothetical protein